MPSSIALARVGEPAFHHSSAPSPASPTSAASQALGSAMLKSRRSTRNADTRRNASTGGTANASNTVQPTTKPESAGVHPASGMSSPMTRASQLPSTLCKTNANTMPMPLPIRPSQTSSPM